MDGGCVKRQRIERWAKRYELQPPVTRKQKGEYYAPCKTRNQKPRETKKDPGTRQRLFPHQIEAVPLRQRSRGARAEVRLFGPQATQAAVSLAVDCAHWRGGQTEWDELQPVHPRAEDRRSRTRPQNSGGPCG